MKILHLASSDQGAGGIKVPVRLNKAFQAAGHESVLLTREKFTFDPGVVPMWKFQSFLQRRISGLHAKLGERYTAKVLGRRADPAYLFRPLYDPNWVATRRVVEGLPFRPDLILAHYISLSFSPRRLFELQKLTGAPIYWILVDMSAFTGGCHFAWDCKGYQQRCGCCPALHSESERDLSRREWNRKNSFYEKLDLRVIVFSDRTEQEAKASSLLAGKPIRKIYLSVDRAVFRPIDRAAARQVLGLPPGKKVLFFGAQMLGEKRKGMAELQRALARASSRLSPQDRDNVVLAVAGLDLDVSRFETGFAVHRLGFLSDDRILAAAYQAADFFLCPSLQETGPFMFFESLACGTPIVSFDDVGASRDLVLEGRTGFRAPWGDAESLGDQLANALTLAPDVYAGMRTACAAIADQHLSPEVQIREILRYHADLGGLR